MNGNVDLGVMPAGAAASKMSMYMTSPGVVMTEVGCLLCAVEHIVDM